MNAYLRLAERLEAQIQSGRLAAGSRIPSVREQSAAEGVSPSTVVAAYGLLQERGWIEPRDRSGYFVSARLEGLAPVSEERNGPSRPISLEAEELVYDLWEAYRDHRILPLGAATPEPDFYPVRAIMRGVARAQRDEPGLLAEYLFPPGSEVLRSEVARRYGHLGVSLSPEAVCTTHGATEAVALALRALVRPGDVLAVENPTYFGILRVVRALAALGCKVVELPTDPVNGLDPGALADAARAARGKLRAAIVVPNHANPTGALMPERAKRELVKVAEAHEVALIEDDVYGDLSYDRVRPLPLKAFDERGTVILCGSFSKTISPSLRIGFVVTERHAHRIALEKAGLSLGGSALAEAVVARYLRAGGYDRHLAHVRKQYQTLTLKFAAAVAASFPEGTRASRPRGGYVLWVQLPDGIDSRVLQRKALEAKISIASGELFSLRQSHRGFIRLNCAIPWSQRLERGIGRLGSLAAGCL